MLEAGGDLRGRLWGNTSRFRSEMATMGFEILPGEHPIAPVMLRDPKLAQEMAAELHKEGVFVTAFSFPVVPKGQDRIRTQMSAAHSDDDLDRGLEAFRVVGMRLGVLG